jgi:hypothetical protein
MGDQFKGGNLAGTCEMHGGEDKCIQIFHRTPGRIDTLEISRRGGEYNIKMDF